MGVTVSTTALTLGLQMKQGRRTGMVTESCGGPVAQAPSGDHGEKLQSAVAGGKALHVCSAAAPDRPRSTFLKVLPGHAGTCSTRCSPLGQPAQWSLLLGVLVFFLFTVPSFVKEPNTKPSSKQNAPELKAVNFKSEPWWDFEENYSFEVGALQSGAHFLLAAPPSCTLVPCLTLFLCTQTCPDSVKVKAARSPWFGPRFLPNLTLFLDSGRFNLSEWRRLEHFAPPFGFMELNFSLVQSVVTRFPPVPQQQLLLADLPAGQPRCISCAVVGNGGILNNSRVGRDIDAHDYVFRLSGAITKGYEEDVGTRTSFYGFTAFSLTQSLYQLGSRGFRHVPLGQNIRYLHFLEHTRDYQWLAALLRNQTLMEKNLFWFRRRPQEVFREALRLDQYLLLHPDLLRYMKNRFLRSGTLDTKRWRIYRPTTGALLLLTALQLCDRVSAYGFITEGHQRFSDHYYDKSWKKLVFYINHDFKLELALWKRLHDQGIIWLYQRPEPPK
ncbi:alpha-N-acetylgalactosaminide alpha-2,6-sialyltransferase 1 [Rhynchocyon petersi]